MVHMHAFALFGKDSEQRKNWAEKQGFSLKQTNRLHAMGINGMSVWRAKGWTRRGGERIMLTYSFQLSDFFLWFDVAWPRYAVNSHIREWKNKKSDAETWNRSFEWMWLQSKGLTWTVFNSDHKDLVILCSTCSQCSLWK